MERFRKVKKLLFNSFLMACLLVAPMAINASADLTTKEVDGVTYRYDPEDVAAGATIIAWPSATGAITIPDLVKLDGFPYYVVAIGTFGDSTGVFQGNTNITSVTIPDFVTTIGGHAFEGCSSLATVHFRSSSRLSTIDSCAFKGSGITEFVGPPSLSGMYMNVFEGCANLVGIFVPDAMSAHGVYLSGSSASYRYVVDSSATNVPAGKTGVRITAAGQLVANTLACNAMGDQYVILSLGSHSSLSGITLTHPNTHYVYTWGENHSSCAAHVVCSSCGKSMSESVQAETIESQITTAPTQNAPGIRTYTATFSGGVPSRTSNDVFIPSSLGNVDLGGITDSSSNVWRYSVDNNAANVPAGKTAVNVTTKVQGSATTLACDAMGSNYVIRSVPANVTLNHSSNAAHYAYYTWGEYHSSCTAHEVYDDCGADTGATIDALSVTSAIKTDPTDQGSYVRTYTARFANEALNTTDTEAIGEVPLTENRSDNHDIFGYQAEGTTQYKASVYWEDAVFVYDRGQFDPNTGEYITTMHAVEANYDGITLADVEMDGGPGEINRWYGFNGWNNRVMVLNRSNDAITASYAVSNPQGGQVGNTTLTLWDYAANDYDENDSTKNGYTVQVLTEADDAHDLAIGDVPYASRYANADRTARFGNEAGHEIEIKAENNNTTKTLPSASNGTMYANKIFFNISGAPSNEFTDQQENPAAIGTITITLNKLNPVTP